MKGSVALLAFSVGGATAAQSDAAPDFSGAWVSSIGWRYLAPAAGAGPVKDDPAHPHVGRFTDTAGRGTTPWVGDASSPILTPWAAEKLRTINAESLGGKDSPKAEGTCVPGGVPMQDTFAEATYFLQTSNKVTILYQRGPNVRFIYLNESHTAHPKPSWNGESIGHYEGGTLVVDTIAQNDKSWTDIYGTPHSDAIHVIERFHLVENGKTLQVDFTVEDPVAFNMPWSGIVKYRKDSQEILAESICAENNTDQFTGRALPIPTAEKSDF